MLTIMEETINTEEGREWYRDVVCKAQVQEDDAVVHMCLAELANYKFKTVEEKEYERSVAKSRSNG